MGGGRKQLERFLPWQLVKYLSAGYVVVSIDYRLAPETKLPGIIADAGDAYAWMRSDASDMLGIDPDQIAVVGHSAGGGLTLICGYRLEPRPKAIVSFYGQGGLMPARVLAKPAPENQNVKWADVQAVLSESIISEDPLLPTEDGSLVPSERFATLSRFVTENNRFFETVFGFDPSKQPKKYSQFSPIRNVTPKYPPTMLLHGDLDDEIPPDNSSRMAEELKRSGVPHQHITLTDFGHGFDFYKPNRQPVQDAFEEVLKFLAKHIRR